MSKFNYFEFIEFVRSNTAKQNNIDNIPTFDDIDRIAALAAVLDQLRAAWKSGIRISSGFRCDALNRLVGGSATSVHKIGYAADLVPVNGKFEEFVKFVEDWLKKNRIKFDQLIIESDSKGDRWLHIGLYNNAGQQRCEVKTMDVK